MTTKGRVKSSRKLHGPLFWIVIELVVMMMGGMVEGVTTNPSTSTPALTLHLNGTGAPLSSLSPNVTHPVQIPYTNFTTSVIHTVPHPTTEKAPPADPYNSTCLEGCTCGVFTSRYLHQKLRTFNCSFANMKTFPERLPHDLQVFTMIFFFIVMIIDHSALCARSDKLTSAS